MTLPVPQPGERPENFDELMGEFRRLWDSSERPSLLPKPPRAVLTDHEKADLLTRAYEMQTRHPDELDTQSLVRIDKTVTHDGGPFDVEG